MSHGDYFNIMDLTHEYGARVEYLGYASAVKYAKLLVKYNLGEYHSGSY